MNNSVALFFLLSFCATHAAIHVFGDSHTRAFATVKNSVIHHLGPRTMHRFGRDKLGCLDIRRYGVRNGDTVIYVFGEIDVRSHIGKQRDRHRRNLTDVIESLIAEYIKAISENRKNYNRLTSIVSAAISPTDGGGNNSQYPRYGTIQDRVAINNLLNKQLLKACQTHGILFLDFRRPYTTAQGTLRQDRADNSVHIHPKHTKHLVATVVNLLKKRRVLHREAILT